MSAPTFTPGPWQHDFSVEGGYDCMTDAYKVRDSLGRLVADLDLGRNPSPKHEEIVEANARLIASAPDLYAALVPFAETDECGNGFLVGGGDHRDPCDECDRILAARAALAKARGEQ